MATVFPKDDLQRAPSRKHYIGQRYSRTHTKMNSSVLTPTSTSLDPTLDLPQKPTSTRVFYIIGRGGFTYSLWYSWMSLMISYSTIMTAFFLAYDFPGSFMILVDRIVWLMFVVDLVLEFFVDFKDEDENLVEDLGVIATTYLKGWFFLDLMAVMPLSEFGYAEIEYYLRMLRILKVKRGLSLFDGSIIGPVILAIAKPKIPADKHKLSVYIRYLVSFIQIFSVLIFTTYVLGAFFFWWAQIMEDVANPWNRHFTDFFTMKNPTPLQEMLRSWYFLTTTLSTVGYGDYYASNMLEKIMLIFILLIGISQFSLIVGQFNGLVAEFDKMSDKDNNMDDLIAWMASIDAVQNHIPPALRAKIIHHFEYYWEHDRLRSLALPWWQAETAEELTNYEDEYLTLLPKGHREAILNHLFADFGVKFSIFFKKNNDFRMDLTPYFQPRLYQPNQFIQRKGKVVEEIVFLVRGEVACGVESGDTFKGVIFYNNVAIIGDAEAIANTTAVASFKVRGSNPVHAFILPAKPVQILLAEKYKSIAGQFLVQHAGKMQYILESLKKFESGDGEKSTIYTGIAARLADRQKRREESQYYTVEEVKAKEEELVKLEAQLTQVRLQNEKEKNALIWEIMQKAA